MGADWQYCIVSFIDLIGTRDEAPTGGASAQMRALHRVVAKSLSGESFRTIGHAYTWNDSVIVLSAVNQPKSAPAALRDLQKLKGQIDSEVCRSFAVVVEGLAFPLPPVRPSRRVTVLKASSWALANCFLVEQKLKHHRASWYIDGGVVRKVPGLKAKSRKELVSMYPKNRKRVVHYFKRDVLFDEV